MSGRSDGAYRARFLKLKSVVEDSVTGLPAYAAVVDRLRAVVDGVRRAGVVVVETVDIDMIEAVYGWQFLDRLNALVSTALSGAVGSVLPSGTIVALDRVAGDRFVVFVPRASSGRAVDTDSLARLCTAIVELLDDVATTEGLSGFGPPLRFRAGHAILTQSAHQRFERRVYAAVADAAGLRAAIDSKRNRLSLEHLERIVRDGDVRTVYHPVIDLDSRASVGWEALSRGPEGSMFEEPSSMFALSGSEAIRPDLDRVCRDAALRGCGALDGGETVFVNVLPDSILRGDWHEASVAGVLSDSRRAPADVVIELSEREMSGDLSPVASAVRTLRDVGFRFAVDDVGTGYGSVETLEAIRPDFVKVDRSVVREIHAHRIKQEAMQSVVRISEGLGASVIAEGVETDAEATAVRKMGVRLAQGYLFAKPCPGDAMRGTP